MLDPAERHVALGRLEVLGPDSIGKVLALILARKLLNIPFTCGEATQVYKSSYFLPFFVARAPVKIEGWNDWQKAED